jgi:hypothetical protein
MSEEDRLKLENELLLTKSKAQMINLYLDLQQKVEQLESIRKEAIEWCKCVVNSKTTAGELPNGNRTDMGYCLDLAEPLLKILEG